MGNPLSIPPSPRRVLKRSNPLPIEDVFKLPSPLPTWTRDEDGFASGIIDLGGLLRACEISSFIKIWAINGGGVDNLGATFFEPSPIPQGFFMLGSHCQPNNKPFFGRVLACMEVDPEGGALAKPTDYTLIWSSESLKIKQDSHGYVWLPSPPNGYNAIGHVITISPEKPSVDKIRCVRSDLTTQCEADSLLWGPGSESDSTGFNVYSSRPINEGSNCVGIPVGTFIAHNNGKNSNSPLPIACLINSAPSLASMPNLTQISSLFQAYSPFIYFHPDEIYLPSSVSWFFNNGALLYTKKDESRPVPIDSLGTNLPLGGSNDGAYWLDLPTEEGARNRVKKGDLHTSEVYLHVKPMFGATFTDIAVWIFYPFNGPARAKVKFVNISLGKIGEHVGDWEHLTLRISNFNGELRKVFFAEHSKGKWVDASELEFETGNRFLAFASLNGHASYPKPGLVLQGNGGFGIRNDTAKSKMVLDTGRSYSVIAAGYLGDAIEEPVWLEYAREWGPKITYRVSEEIRKVEKLLFWKLRSGFRKLINSLPDEVLGEEGPTGPKMKNNWNGDEVSS